MIFIILAIIGMFVLYRLIESEKHILFVIVLAFNFAMVFAFIKSMNGYSETAENIKESQLKIAEEYKLSDKDDEAWNYLTSKLSEKNKKVDNLKDNDIIWKMIDIYYLFSVGSNKEYKVELSEDRVVFPEHYDTFDIVKEKSKEEAYEEIEIDGKKYQLVPID